MVKVRKVLGVIVVGLSAIALALTVWDRPVEFPGLTSIPINFFGGDGVFGNMNFLALFLSIIIMEIAVGVAVFPTPSEIRKEREIRQSLNAIRLNNEKIAKELTTEKMKHSELRNRFKEAVKDRRTINKSVNDLVLKGTKAFKGGNYPAAVEYWEKALAVEHEKTLRAMRIAEEKLDLQKVHNRTGQECPYCGAPLFGYEEICPECGENLLTEEEMVRKYLLEGLRLFITGEMTGATSTWEKVLDIDPTNEEALSYITKAQDARSEKAMMDRQVQLPPAVATPVEEDEEIELDDDDDDLGIDELDDDIGRIADMLNDAAPSMDAVSGPRKGHPPESLVDGAPTAADEMYECEVCGAPMKPEQFICPVCGEVYEE